MASNVPYLKLITSEYANQPLFNAYVEAFLNLVSPVEDALDDFQLVFQLATATGDQLDKLGSLIGLGRSLPVSNPNIPAVLPDDLYRKVLYCRIYSNHWDGSRQALDAIFSAMFAGLPYELADNQDMSYSVSVIDPTFSAQDLALLQEGYILPKPSGVLVEYNIVDKPLFGWDSDTNFIKGWDLATWRGT